MMGWRGFELMMMMMIEVGETVHNKERKKRLESL